MPFKPLRLLIAYDNARGYCDAVVPRLKEQLEERAFEVDTHVVDGTPVDLEDYDGLVLGTPVTGLALRAGGPTARVAQFIQEADGLDEKRVAIFCVYDVRPGGTFDRMKNLLLERGAEHVAEHAYWRLKPSEGEEILPAECMVRIR